MASEAPLDVSAFKETLVVLGATAAVIPVFHRLKLSPIIGFIFIGMAIGPFGLGALAGLAPDWLARWLSMVTITEPEAIAPVAEWGVVLLLFMIGLELSLERLSIMTRLVFGLGFAQVTACTMAIAGVLMLAGFDTAPALILGVALAQSSTAVLVQVLADEKKLSKPVGRASFAVLLFQDIAVVPILFGVAVLGATKEGSLLGAFGTAVAQAALGVVALIVVGRVVLRRLFRNVARTKSPDLFLAACVLVILVTALGASAAGLSAAMGALIAGMLLAETEYRRQVEVLIEPFKGLLLGVFLISAGMTIDLGEVAKQPHWVALAAVGLVALKTAITFALGLAFRLKRETALSAALLLGPGGEFAFVILGAAGATALVPAAASESALVLAAVTMASIPFLSRLTDRLARNAAEKSAASEIDPALSPPGGDAGAPPAVIAGFGRVGRLVADMLERHGVPYLALDTDVDLVSAARREGKNVYYGDASNPAMLRQIGIATMRAVIATMDSPAAVEAVVSAARQERQDLIIVARARDARHAARLYRLGATDVAPETIEASLQLSEAVLVDLGVPMGPVIASIHDKRAEFREEVRRLAPDAQVPARRRARTPVRGETR